MVRLIAIDIETPVVQTASNPPEVRRRRLPACRGPHGRSAMRSLEKQKIVLDSLKSNCSRAGAAAEAGVSLAQLQREIQVNPRFQSQVIEAEERGITQLVKRIDRISETNWRAAAWILERKRPDEWGKQVSETNVDCHVNVQQQYNVLSIEQRRSELLNIVDSIRERIGSGENPGTANGSNGHNGNGYHTP